MSTLLLWTALLALTALFLAAVVVRGTRRRVFHDAPSHPYRRTRGHRQRR